MKNSEEYEPFNEEWVKEMMKFSKKVLIENWLKPSMIERNELLETLVEISKGEGRYDMDQLKHASNTIEDMKELAEEAIQKLI
jgi:hypothetical protein